MNNRRAPRVATWLLQRFLHGRHTESVVGDLIQLHGEGRSRAWYWNQVLRAILVGCVHAMRASGHSLILALVVSWGAILVWWQLNAAFVDSSGDVYWSLRAYMRGFETAPDVRNTILVLVWGIGALLRFLLFGVSGWLAARLNARHPQLAVLVLAASVAIWPMPWEQVRVLDVGTQWLAHYGTALVGIFIGGYLAGTQRTQRKSGQRSALPESGV